MTVNADRMSAAAKLCWTCDKPATQLCSQCSVARYCDVTCQRADWKVHKRVCGPPTAPSQPKRATLDDLHPAEKATLEMFRGDKEFPKMCAARVAASNREHGFQGCVNLGKGCDFDGFYLATYSPEGECGKC